MHPAQGPVLLHPSPSFHPVLPESVTVWPRNRNFFFFLLEQKWSRSIKIFKQCYVFHPSGMAMIASSAQAHVVSGTAGALLDDSY